MFLQSQNKGSLNFYLFSFRKKTKKKKERKRLKRKQRYSLPVLTFCLANRHFIYKMTKWNKQKQNETKPLFYIILNKLVNLFKHIFCFIKWR